MPVWPSDLLPCQPVRGSLVVTAEPNVAEFVPDVGGPLRRRRYSSAGFIYSADIVLTINQRLHLLTLYHDECGDGVLSFDMADWADDTGAVRSFSWVSPPQLARVTGSMWRASLTLRRAA